MTTLKLTEPGLWSHHPELSPVQPTLLSYPKACASWDITARSPEALRLALYAHCRVSLLLYLSFPSHLVFFQVWREKNNIISPQVVPTHIFWGLQKAETSLVLLNHSSHGLWGQDEGLSVVHVDARLSGDCKALKPVCPTACILSDQKSGFLQDPALMHHCFQFPSLLSLCPYCSIDPTAL